MASNLSQGIGVFLLFSSIAPIIFGTINESSFVIGGANSFQEAIHILWPHYIRDKDLK